MPLTGMLFYRLVSFKVPKKLVSSFLLLHGKLFTKIGYAWFIQTQYLMLYTIMKTTPQPLLLSFCCSSIESFPSSVELFARLLLSSLASAEEELAPEAHLLKMAVINIFSIHNSSESFHGEPREGTARSLATGTGSTTCVCMCVYCYSCKRIELTVIHVHVTCLTYYTYCIVMPVLV